MKSTPDRPYISQPINLRKPVVVGVVHGLGWLAISRWSLLAGHFRWLEWVLGLGWAIYLGIPVLVAIYAARYMSREMTLGNYELLYLSQIPNRDLVRGYAREVVY